MKKFIAIVAVVAGTSLALAGCGDAMTSAGVSIEAEQITLPNGQQVVCVVASGGGVDCNFGG